MAYNEKLTNRVRAALVDQHDIEEKKMFRGICFMVKGKMCLCVGDDELMCRFDPAMHDTIMEKSGCREMMRGKKALRGFVFVKEAALASKKELDFWVSLALAFNQFAKASPKAKKNRAHSARISAGN